MKTILDYAALIITAFLPSSETGRAMTKLAYRMLYKGGY